MARGKSAGTARGHQSKQLLGAQGSGYSLNFANFCYINVVYDIIDGFHRLSAANTRNSEGPLYKTSKAVV